MKCEYVHAPACCEHPRAAHAVRVIDWYDDEPRGICERCDDAEIAAYLADDDYVDLSLSAKCVHYYAPAEVCGRPEHAPLYPDEPHERIYKHLFTVKEAAR